jgi:hypothetical protein
MLGLITAMISRLSRAAVIRKWNIEVGTRRNFHDIIQEVKKEIKNKSIAFSDLTSIKNISKMLTDFRDIATITKDGQRFIDFEILPTHDRSLPIQELQDLRNELIMATGIPAVYLNSAETIDLRETLVNLNINFANDIINKQSYIEEGLNSLLSNIFNLILEMNGINDKINISNLFEIKLNPPLVLQLQSNEALITSVGNIVGLLNQMQVVINPSDLLKHYIPSIDWDKLIKEGEKFKQEETKQAIIQQEIQNQMQQGM